MRSAPGAGTLTAHSLSIAEVRKQFGARTVLDGVSLEVAPGSFTAILGASGSGKTTLLRVIAGFDRADSGTIALGGQAVDGPRVFTPPERCCGRRFSKPASPTSVSSSATRASALPRSRSPKATFFATFRCGNNEPSCGT